jgi:hypothetical protein
MASFGVNPVSPGASKSWFLWKICPSSTGSKSTSHNHCAEVLAKPITMVLWNPTVAAAQKAYIDRVLWLLIALKQIPGAFSTCMATSGSGPRIAGTTATSGTLGMALLERVEIAVGVSSAAVPGKTFHGTSARPSARGTPPAQSAGAAILSVFGWPER